MIGGCVAISVVNECSLRRHNETYHREANQVNLMRTKHLNMKVNPASEEARFNVKIMSPDLMLEPLITAILR